MSSDLPSPSARITSEAGPRDDRSIGSARRATAGRAVSTGPVTSPPGAPVMPVTSMGATPVVPVDPGAGSPGSPGTAPGTEPPPLGTLGVGGLLGASAGYAAKKLSRVALLAVGLGFLLVQLLAWQGWIEVHWEQVEAEIGRAHV